jgi:hypothetical protein
MAVSRGSANRRVHFMPGHSDTAHGQPMSNGDRCVVQYLCFCGSGVLPWSCSRFNPVACRYSIEGVGANPHQFETASERCLLPIPEGEIRRRRARFRKELPPPRSAGVLPRKRGRAMRFWSSSRGAGGSEASAHQNKYLVMVRRGASPACSFQIAMLQGRGWWRWLLRQSCGTLLAGPKMD